MRRHSFLSAVLPSLLLATACESTTEVSSAEEVLSVVHHLGAQTATYDTTLRVPTCTTPGISCYSGSLLLGRATLGPEPHQPNTLQGTCADGTSGSYHKDESLDELRVLTEDGTDLAPGKRVRIEARVWVHAGYTSDKLDLYYTANAQSPSWTFIGTLTPTGGGSQLLSTTYVLPTGSLQAIRGVFRYGGSAASCNVGIYSDHDDLAFVTVPAVPDTIPPTIALTAPAPGATVDGVVELRATARDNVNVTRVEFYAGTSLVGTDTSSPYTANWDTRPLPEGSVLLTTKAFDAADNSATSAEVTVTVDHDTTPPSVSCSAPAEGATVSNTVTLEAIASDDVGVVRVDFYDGTTLLGSDTTAPYTFSWDTLSGIQGARTLSCLAWDAAQNSTTATRSVTVKNPGLATYDPELRAPRCALGATLCDTRELLVGRGLLGPETNAPNTLNNACADGAVGVFHSDRSFERLVIYTQDGSPLTEGKKVTIEATVWASVSYGVETIYLYHAPNARSPNWVHMVSLGVNGSGLKTGTTTFTLPAGGLQALRAVYTAGPASPCDAGIASDRDDLVFEVQPRLPDTTPPQLSLDSPTAGLVRGDVSLLANVSDDEAVARVEFYVNGSLLSTLTNPLYGRVWNSRNVSNGPVTISALAYDTSGNVSTASVDVVVDNDYQDPTVAFTSPTANTEVSGTIPIQVTTSDNVGVTRVKFFHYSTPLGESTTPPFTFNLDTLMLKNGIGMRIRAQAFDAAGNSAYSEELPLNVYNPGNVGWDATLKVPACNYERTLCDSSSLLDGRSTNEAHTPNTLYASCADGSLGLDTMWSPSVDGISIRSVNKDYLTRGQNAHLEVPFQVPTNYYAYTLDIYYATSVTSPVWTKLTTWEPQNEGWGYASVIFQLPPSASTRMAVRAVMRSVSSPSAACSIGDWSDHDDLVFRVR